MSDRMRWGSGSDWDNDGWGGGCAPCPPAPCPPSVCTSQPCPPVACPPCPPPWFGPPRPPWYPGAAGGVSFGATPPQFPIRGHFWWDGLVLHMWDGVEWETIGPAGGGSITGSVDGSAAAPGIVGEYVQLSTQVSYPTSLQNVTVNAGTLQPGDWDCWAIFAPNEWVGGAEIKLSPQPPAVSNSMIGLVGDQSTVVVVGSSSIVIGLTARCLSAAPVTFNFQVITNFIASGSTAGVGQLSLNARRRR
jgi:hypothetical protein